MHLYLTLSKCYFVPAVFHSSDALSEPFRSAFTSFQAGISDGVNDLRDAYPDSGYLPSGLHIPHVGKVTFLPKKNVASRMFLGCEFNQSRYRSYRESPEFRSVLHVPLLVNYRKKVQFESNQLGIKTNPIRVYLHIYPAGYYFIHAAVAVQSMYCLQSLVEWLGKMKLDKSSSTALQLSVNRCFIGSLSGFFSHIWSHVSQAILSDTAAKVLESPIYDITRIKPLQSVSQDAITKHESFLDSFQRVHTEDSLAKIPRRSQCGFHSWEELFDAIFTWRDAIERQDGETGTGRSFSLTEWQELDGINRPTEWEFELINRLRKNSPRHRGSTDAEALKHLRTRLYFRSKWSRAVDLALRDDLLRDDVRGMSEQLQYLQMHGSNDFPDWIRGKLINGITKALRRANPVRIGVREIAGLLSKDRNWRELSCDEGDYKSIYGKYGGDLIVAKNQSALVKTEAWSARRQLQLLFHWRLVAVYEVACAQGLASEAIRNQIDHFERTGVQESSFTAISHKFNMLATIHRHLPTNHRKWYYRVSSAIGTDRRIEEVGKKQSRFDQGDLMRRLSMHEYKMEAVILFLGANPSNQTQLDLAKEAQAIGDQLRSTDLRDQFRIEQQWEPKAQQIPGKILRFRPTIVHFSGHGSRVGKLVLVDDKNIAREADTEAIAEVFRLVKETVRCVVLNACYSEAQAAAIAEHVQVVVGMSQAIGDTAAIQFSSSFYEALGYGRSFQKAFEFAILGMKLGESGDAPVPRIYFRKDVDPENSYCF